MQSLVGSERWPAVERACRAAFGIDAPESLERLTGGLSGAGVFRMSVEGRLYLLRLENDKDRMVPLALWQQAMRIAAEAGIAPKVHQADVSDRLAILDFVEEQPLTGAFEGRRDALMDALAATLNPLHATPGFPELMPYFTAVGFLVNHFQQAVAGSPALLAPALDAFEKIKAAYHPRPRDHVSSHNDLNPRNILFDGARLWLVDWESSFAADRYVDLAAAANFFARGPQEAQRLAVAYFGRAPTEDEQARFHVMRQVNLLFHAVALMLTAMEEAPDLRLDALDGPDLVEMQRRIRTSEVNLGRWQDRFDYGRAKLGAALAAFESPAFGVALAVLASDSG